MKIFASKQPYLLFYILFAIILTLMMEMYSFPEALDISRNYSNAIRYAKIYDLDAYFQLVWEEDNDFIYTCSLFVFAKLNFPLTILTVTYLSIYYISMCEVIRLITHTEVNGVILIIILLFAPFVWIQAIGRNTAAIAFFYLAIFYKIKGHRILSLIFVILSVFSHFSMLLWVLLSLLIKRLHKNNIKRILSNNIYIIICIISILSPTLISKLLSVLSLSGDIRYLTYFLLTAPPLQNSSIGYMDKIPMVFNCIYSSSIVMICKNRDSYYWMLYFLSAFLMISTMTNIVFTNRITMFMPLFLGINVCSIIKTGDIKTNNFIYYLSLVGLVSIFLHFWGYRHELFSI